jgi:hypothetical protein
VPGLARAARQDLIARSLAGTGQGSSSPESEHRIV